MSVFTHPVRHDFDDYVRHSESHSDGTFELIDGVIYTLAPEGDAHLVTRSGIHIMGDSVDRSSYTPWTEASFPATGWADGPRPDNFVSRGPWRVAGAFAKRPAAEDIALVIEASPSSRPKDRQKAQVYARLGIPESCLVDFVAGTVIVYSDAVPNEEHSSYSSICEYGKDRLITSCSVDGLSVDTNFLVELAT